MTNLEIKSPLINWKRNLWRKTISKFWG